MSTPNYAKAEEEAKKLIKNLGFASPPIDIVEIASHLNINIYKLQLPAEYKNVSGFIDFANNRVMLNKLDPPARQVFTSAHEIGHYVLHKDHIMKHPEQYRVLFRDKLLEDGGLIEKEANCFAANLLVPFELLEKYLDYPESIIASIFQVSAQVIKYRLKDLRRNEK